MTHFHQQEKSCELYLVTPNHKSTISAIQKTCIVRNWSNEMRLKNTRGRVMHTS
uniref:Uncharacterized protein n=1 Tax=Arundo donax TaxID=35708 RepID=A0A0A9BEH9_ARUDO